MKLDINNAFFTYYFADYRLETLNRFNKLGKYIISYSDNTECMIAEKGGSFLCITGFCVDAHGEVEREMIPSYLLDNSENILQIINNSNRLAGKFVVIYVDNADVYAFSDATASMQINYLRDDDALCFSSNEKLIADHYNLLMSEKGKIIRNSGEFSQAMPNDITPYERIKFLLPNNYLDSKSKTSCRFYPADEVSEHCDIQDVAENTIKLVDNIVSQYSKYYKLSCPLTSGWDSRLVLAFLKNAVDDLQCYTFNHPGFSEKTGDLVIPKKITSDLGLHHMVIDDKEATEDYIEYFNETVGKMHSARTINLAYTYNSRLSGIALINGDIAGQIGKSIIGQKLPEILATTSFLICKLHNFSSEAKEETKKWLKGTKEHRGSASAYDLFAWENRLGRWASQISMLYANASISSLNIFNCREIILLWLKVPRELRYDDKAIHKSIFSLIAPELLNYPCNAYNVSDKMSGIIKSNSISYYLATNFKFLIQKLQFKLNNG